MKTTFTRRFSAAHRIAGDPGKCHRIHGHNYTATIEVLASVLGENNFLVPADLIKAVVDVQYDHRLILSRDDPLEIDLPSERGLEHHGDWVIRVEESPSTEFLAQKIARDVADTTQIFLGEKLGMFPSVEVNVLLEETPTIQARASVSRPSGRMG